MALFGILLGFAGFLGSLGAVIWRGFDRNGQQQSAFWPLAVATVVFLALLLFSLTRYPAPFPV
jgi:hypothetical protein